MTVCVTINFQGRRIESCNAQEELRQAGKLFETVIKFFFRDCWNAMHLNGRSSPESKSEALAFDLLCSYTVCENGEFWNI